MPNPVDPADWMAAWTGTPPAGPEGATAIRRIKEFGDDYLGITRELWNLVESGKAGDPASSPQWLREGLEGLRAGFKDQFTRLYAAAGMAGPQPLMPVFGPPRIDQESHERLVAAIVRCQRAAQRFNELLAAIAANAVELLASALTATDPARPPITSLRELHNLWVDCGEQAYAAAAHGDDFAAAQAELLAATVELRCEQQRMAETWARAFNLPTWSEIDAISERVQALRRRVRELECEVARHGEPQR